MKKFNFIGVILISLLLIACNKSNTLKKSGEIIRGDKKITYTIIGEGIPCFVCADSKIQENCISDNLKNHFQFVFMEQRHSNLYDVQMDYSQITMDTIISDIELLRNKLDFNKVYVLGHSIIGLIAIEYGREYPKNTHGVIMINTPPHFNMGYMKKLGDYWENNASKERKEIFKNKQDYLKRINRDSISQDELSKLQQNLYVPKNWFNPNYNASSKIPHFRINNEGWNHFYSLVRNYDIARTQIKVPIFLSLAEYDFMTPSFLWDDYKNKLSMLDIYNFEYSGHFPHVEEQNNFDEKLLNWAKLK